MVWISHGRYTAEEEKEFLSRLDDLTWEELSLILGEMSHEKDNQKESIRNS